MSLEKTDRTEQGGWWNSPPILALLVVGFCIPLIWPAIPPLNDLPNHLARFHIELMAGKPSPLHQWYTFKWMLVPNIGFDLLIIPATHLFGLELGAKLLVIAIVALTVLGMLAFAREVHGYIPAPTLFALPLTYNFAFQLGFLNFTLGMALALLASAAWLNLGRRKLFWLRAALFAIISTIIFLAHSQAWGLFGIIIFGLEVGRFVREKRGYPAGIFLAGVSCLPLIPPLLLTFFWLPHAQPGATYGFLYWPAKAVALASVFRNSSGIFDMLSAWVLFSLFYAGVFRKHLLIDASVIAVFLLMSLVFILMPVVVMASGFNDARIAPYLLAIGILGLRVLPDNRRFQSHIALAALLFIGCRLAVQTWFYAKLDRGYQAQLVALDHIPTGSRIVSLVNMPCFGDWHSPRLDHLSQMAIVRRDSFVNGQWTSIAMLSTHYPQGGQFVISPSHQTFPEECDQIGSYSVDYAIRHFPRGAFDYFWMVGFPPSRWPKDEGLQPVWRGTKGVLFRVVHAQRTR
jgi:Uncharacterized conserved protein